MNKQELFKQADYNFQRGNRELAKKYMLDFLDQYPREETAWMLMARIEEEPALKKECYQQVLRINPGNSEARLWLSRIETRDKILPRRNQTSTAPAQFSGQWKGYLRGASIFLVFVILFGATSYVVAKSGLELTVPKFLVPATPTLSAQIPVTGNIAAQTRAEVKANYPQYALFMDTLIDFATNSADSESENAPQRPGEEIVPSDTEGTEAKTSFENALPKPGSLSSATLTELQLTSWLAMEMKTQPDFPLSDVQVYLRENKIEIWGTVTGSKSSTSALIVGNIAVDANKKPTIGIESIQIGEQMLPEMLVSQMESWLNQMLADEIDKQAPGLKVMSIKVTNGLMTISGMR